MSAPPKISVVTVNFNMADQIGPTLDSVFAQDYPNFESIVIDGGSTDGSREIIAGFGGRLAHWVSEPDRGLYDGMNKGVAAATGDWVLFMNSGDRFASSTVLSDMFRDPHEDADLVYGDHIRVYPDHGVERILRAEPPSVLPLRMHCSHQSLFMRREILFERPFAMNLLAADYDAILSAYVNGKTFKHVPCIVAIAAVGGRSDRYRLTILMQRMRVVRRNGLLSWGTFLHYVWLIMRVLTAAFCKALLPKSVIVFVLRHRTIRGLG
jgi:glycosyltransferase involved in cell wall biosynthesis